MVNPIYQRCIALTVSPVQKGRYGTTAFERIRRSEAGFERGIRNPCLLAPHTDTISKDTAWLVSERILNWGSEPLLRPKNGIVKIYGPSMYCVVFLDMVAAELAQLVEQSPCKR